ncbi:MAG: SDR family oxidoreductase [Desulfarculaceae bacterium]|nr:SDR family oxidoreductase [Desulfarculaceae bacterium]MCF8048538.1 SDR family oxidoreductase [Desulfarculaceae bacterium]MCF8064955.1 SDR family oxidoreductase [Desulfarculaceae bacterium]MCF8097325.1 SDR family oxidoreductase [Desulfarculaceae bacterium]MCF8121868.1 SDR family oxidoreductase [Desulfarculaceae bacterium]
MPTYLITGGAGFIGSHLAQVLSDQGETVRVLDNLVSGKMRNLEPARRGKGDFSFLEGDIRDLDTCHKAMEGVDYVLHQAARPSVQRSIEDPLASHEVNATGSLNILWAAKEAGVKRVVVASSSSIYGDVEPESAPKEESLPPKPLSPYAVSKVAMENYCTAFYKVYGLETVRLRYFNVFGPRQDPESPYAAVVPKFLFALTSGEAPTVLGDGRQSRDFTYVDNVVAANLAACIAPEAPGQAINVAAGVSHDLLDLLQVLGELLDSDIQPKFGPARSGEVRYSLASLAQARRVLGYEPKVDFHQGLARLVELAVQGRYLD